MQSIFFPLIEPLTKITRLQDKDYETMKLIQALENITGKQFITKRENRLIRR